LLVDQGFTLVERLYTSSRSMISRAIRKSDGRPVIIKSLVAAHPSTPQLARFSYACELQKGFDHPGIVKVLEGVQFGTSPFIVLEDVGAIPLHDYVAQQQGGRLRLDVFFELAIQMSSALAEIHARRIIHKDLHPGNILVHPASKRVQITDFDLSSLLPREQPSLVSPDALEGVLAYMSPEQTGRMNRSLDHRTDLYSLGVMFYLMLSGHLPFEEDSPIAMVHAHIARLAKPLEKVRPEIPPPLARLVDKLMAKNAEARYQSAAGLKYDLQFCQQCWLANHQIEDFPLAQQDLSDRLQLSQKLYGRERQIAQLLSAFQQARDGLSQLMTVAGYSGVGKSSLVQEAHKVIAAHGGWFIAGKFDAFKRNTPYSALHEAFKTWVQLALAGHASQVQRLREQLTAGLGANAAVLTEFQPDLSLLLGEPPELPQLGSQETQNRFHRVMQQFIEIITRDQPLVLFLDDLQWADLGTLSLLRVILKAPERQLLLIVSYRDNEVSESHPSLLALRTIQQDLHQHPERCHALTLSPLQLNDLQQLLEDSLHRQEGTQALAQLILDKTAGNPFFINEFLRTLHSDGLIEFNTDSHRWVWDLERIRNAAITDNVVVLVVLMLEKMRRLPPSTYRLLQLASCIGSQFDLASLAQLEGHSPQRAAQLLWPALQEGLLQTLSGDWFTGTPQFELKDQPLLTALEAATASYRFLHDRMQQAAYESLDNTARQQTHLAIGRMLLASSLDPDRSNLFSVVEHLNYSRTLIASAEERLSLAALNSEAARLAKRSCVWAVAARHASLARELLPEDAWTHCYELTAQVYLQSVECENLNANFEEAELLAEATLPMLRSGEEKARICLVLLNSNIVRGKRDYAFAKGVEGLAHCGIRIPTLVDVEPALKIEQQRFAELTQDTPLVQQIRISQSGHPRVALVSSLFSTLMLATYVAGKKSLNSLLCYKGMQFVLEHGLSDETAAIMSHFVIIDLRQGHYHSGYALAAKANEYVDAAQNKGACLQAYLFSGTTIWLYFRPLQEANALLWKGYQYGMENGDLSAAVGSFSNITINRFAKGDPLGEVNLHVDQLVQLMQQHKLAVSAGRHYQRLLQMLMQPDSPDLLKDETFSPLEWQIINNTTLIAFIQHLRLQWLFWSDQPEAALQQLAKAETAMELITGFAPNIDHPLLAALLHSRHCSKSDSALLNAALAVIETQYHALRQMAHCPSSFEHKLQLLQAEQARLQGRTESAIEHYRAAVVSARQYGFLQYEALANELLGRFLWEIGWQEFAEVALKQAHFVYGRWGCAVKQRRLEREFPEVGEAMLTVPGASISSSSTSSGSFGLRGSSQLDLESILKSSQTLSSELVLDRLLQKMLHIMLENAGAQSASLVLKQHEGLELAARVSTEEDGTLQNRECNSTATRFDCARCIPVDMMHYVLATQKSLLIQDVAANETWSRDPYIQCNRPQSILCLPVHYRDSLTGVLYLENTLTPNAFTDQRLQVLELLLTQASISLENARLFEEVQSLNSDLELKVEQRTSELRAVNKELEAFSYSVSHDLRGPLRNINGFSKMLLEQYHEVLGEEGRDLIQRVRRNTEKMANLISGLLELSKVSRCELHVTEVDLTAIAIAINEELQTQNPEQTLTWRCMPTPGVNGDARLLNAALENLLNNAWKYCSKTPHAQIEFGALQQDGGRTIFYVRDNGAGFDMRHAQKLFTSFQRLHSEKEFAGTGIGLATVQRIIQRHGGDIWAEAELNRGACFYFTVNLN